MATAVRGYDAHAILDTLAANPGVDTEARSVDGARIFAVNAYSDRKPTLLDLFVPVHDTLSDTEVLGIVDTAYAAIRAQDVMGQIILLRRGGTASESVIREILVPTDRTYDQLRWWWDLSSQDGVSIRMDERATDVDLLLDATDLPDRSPEAIPGIDRLRNLLDTAPPESSTSEYDVWTVRDRGPEITLTGRAAHLLDQATWDGLTGPALDGLVESIQINDRQNFYHGRLMASARGTDDRLPGDGDESPSVVWLTLTDRTSPLLEAEAVRTLHATPGLRYLRLPLDTHDEYDPGYTIDLRRCSPEVSEERLRATLEPEDGAAPAAPATLARSDSRTTTTEPSTLRRPPPGVSDEANEAAWEFWRLLGCD